MPKRQFGETGDGETDYLIHQVDELLYKVKKISITKKIDTQSKRIEVFAKDNNNGEIAYIGAQANTDEINVFTITDIDVVNNEFSGLIFINFLILYCINKVKKAFPGVEYIQIAINVDNKYIASGESNTLNISPDQKFSINDILNNTNVIDMLNKLKTNLIGVLQPSYNYSLTGGKRRTRRTKKSRKTRRTKKSRRSRRSRK